MTPRERLAVAWAKYQHHRSGIDKIVVDFPCAGGMLGHLWALHPGRLCPPYWRCRRCGRTSAHWRLPKPFKVVLEGGPRSGEVMTLDGPMQERLRFLVPCLPNPFRAYWRPVLARDDYIAPAAWAYEPTGRWRIEKGAGVCRIYRSTGRA